MVNEHLCSPFHASNEVNSNPENVNLHLISMQYLQCNPKPVYPKVSPSVFNGANSQESVFSIAALINLWNCLPQDVVMAPDLDAFKRVLNRFMKKRPSEVTSSDDYLTAVQWISFVLLFVTS